MSRRNVRPDRAGEVLHTLFDAFPAGVPTHVLVETHGWKAQARIVELRKLGWNIETDEGSTEATYTLLSTVRGEPEPEVLSTVRISQMSDGTVRLQAPKGDDTLRSLIEAEAVGVLIHLTDADLSVSTIERRETGKGIVFRVVPADPEPEIVVQKDGEDWFSWCQAL